VQNENGLIFVSSLFNLYPVFVSNTVDVFSSNVIPVDTKVITELFSCNRQIWL